MNKIKFLVFVLLVFRPQIVFACPSDAKSLGQANQIWEQAIIAIGGRDRILSIKNILTRDTNRPLVALDVLPDKYWDWSKNSQPLGTVVSTHNFATNIGYIVKSDEYWPSYPLTGVSKELYLAGMLNRLLETKWIKPTLLGAETTVINKKPYDIVCLEITFPKNQKDNELVRVRHEYVFDKVTHLLFRDIRYFTQKEGGGNYFEEYSNYKEVKGVKMATSYFGRYSNGGVAPKVESIIDLDVEYRKDLFDKQPSIKDGKDGWKPK